MSLLTDEIRGLIERASMGEKRIVLAYLREQVPLHPLEREWGTTAEAVMAAIARSPGLTQRGIRGILAEATFENQILPRLERSGWRSTAAVGLRGYDFSLRRGRRRVRVQVKLQRRERGLPKEFAARSRAALVGPSGKLFVAEVQRTRGGVRQGRQTRPYRFGDFDILAVNLHPSTGEWRRFLYTVGDWLLPRPGDPELVAIMQPVPEAEDDYWTADLSRCIKWFFARRRRQLYSGG